MIRRKGITVEICLSGNDMISDTAGKDHPLTMYLTASVPVSLTSNDEAVSRSNLTIRYVNAAQEQNLSYADLKNIAQNGLNFSFLHAGLYDEQGRISSTYTPYLTGALPTESQREYKAYLQIQHERDLIFFENKCIHCL